MSIRTIGELNAPGTRPGRRTEAPQTVARSQAAPADAHADPAELNSAVEAVNQMLDPLARGLQFSVDVTTGKTIVKLVDKETNEVIRQMPSREMLAIARALDRVQGLLLRDQA